MPRVVRRTKTKGGKHTYRCDKCGNEIEPKQVYLQWEFRYGGKYRRHAACGYPRPSELTQSKMGEVYAATESVDDILAGDFDEAEIVAAMESAQETIQYVADEYEQAAEPFGNAGENQERYEELDSWVSDFDSIDYTREDDEDDETWRDRIRDEVQGIIGNCPY